MKLHQAGRRLASRILLDREPDGHSGEIRLTGLNDSVEVLRDRRGIPHIYAENETDLWIALGFVHAQDRLWQMESLRRSAAGTLAEIAGPGCLLSDRFFRLIGLPRLCTAAVEGLEPGERAALDAYSSGVNAFLDTDEADLPMEFRKLNCAPAPWRPSNCFAGLALNSWFLQPGYLERILAVRTRGRLSRAQWDELFPVYPGAEHPQDAYFERYRPRKFGRFLPEALGHLHPLLPGAGGSNNWAVADGPGGKPLIANDPHLAMMVPQIWYICHLQCPGIHLAGVTMPGAPLLVLGRNDDVAWTFTNSMGNCVDLFLFEVDPRNPTSYRVGERIFEMEREETVFGVSGGDVERFTVLTTIHGPVITEVAEGVDAVAVLKWFGTLPPEQLDVRAPHAFFALNRAGNLGEAFEATRDMTIVGQNLIAADVAGDIGWRVFGSYPKRRGYSGRLPADGSDGSVGWSGFLPDRMLPRRINPPEGFLVTANNRMDVDPAAPPISYDWATSHRCDRIVELLNAEERHTVESFNRIQLDCRSRRAESVVPVVLGFTFTRPEAVEGGRILADWNREMRAESRGAAVFAVFLWQLLDVLLADALGADLKLYLCSAFYCPSLLDVVFDTEDVGRWKAGATLAEVCEEAMAAAIGWLQASAGRNRRRWTWGAVHRYVFRHPGATGGAAGWLLNRGPFPASGSCDTVNVSGYTLPLKGFEVDVAPSMRLIADLADPEKLYIGAPMGQSGRPGHRHYDDLIDPWLTGKLETLYLRRERVEASARHRMVLRRRDTG